MKHWIIRVTGLAVIAGAFLFAAGGWTKPLRSTNEKPVSVAAVEDAIHTETPDAKRDVLIPARSAMRAPALLEGTWINSDSLTLKALQGRVVVVDFWTFGCHNCRNTLPTLKRWDTLYRKDGLTTIGVHSPESDYEKNMENVRREVQRLGISYPVVTDNNYETWRAYGIHAWPTTVILDKQGRVRFTHIGEGMYNEMEQVIQKLLAEETKSTKANSDSSRGKGLAMTEKINKTDEEWQREMTPEQFQVMRKKGTERAFTGTYNDNHEKGVYYCAACHNELFNSDTKFDSGTGWPSFYAPTAAAASVKEVVDASHGMKRTEVVCARCDAHLGHVFDDGPKPTGLRYCMNSISLDFEKK
ncbi:MAG: peptide-methionine (R)-S-oxide reductase MsrB [Pyrinomonadaceae bacterium]|nr:peptide-methionine (R)-S-oxide reductase MsrB [Pyrinomonadaceae bacterium]